MTVLRDQTWQCNAQITTLPHEPLLIPKDVLHPTELLHGIAWLTSPLLAELPWFLKALELMTDMPAD